MNILDRARQLRTKIEGMATGLEDEEALKVTEFFPNWEEGKDYAVGNRVRYEGILYKCLIAHKSQSDWIPKDAVSLWAKVLISGGIPEWEQPGSTNPYMKGDKVRHNGKIWISDIDYNVYEPSVYGWSEVTA